jgi:hypothetical protein
MTSKRSYRWWMIWFRIIELLNRFLRPSGAVRGLTRLRRYNFSPPGGDFNIELAIFGSVARAGRILSRVTIPDH